MVEELQRRNYSPSTIRGYILAVKQFGDYFGKPPDRLGATHVQRFQWYLLQERKLTPGTVEMRMSALRFFFKKVLKRRDMHFDDLPFPKTPRKLPTVLSPEEVRRMIDGTTNLMHRTLLMVLYGTGVRRTELSLVLIDGWSCNDIRRETTEHQLRNSSNYLKRIINQQTTQLTSLPDVSLIRVRCSQDHTPKAGANADHLNVVKILEYGDNIEIRIDGRSLLADQS
jgi:site-specific recombinase XerD